MRGLFGRAVEHEQCQRDHQRAMEELAIQITRTSRAQAERDKMAGEIAQIRACLAEVAVYEGLVEISPTVAMVSDLVRDHEELEARIDASLHYLAGLVTNTEAPEALREMGHIVADLLRGGKRVPDSPGDLI